jgi:CDP-glycerol glycerophosphotransferase (TagB/SpsB family)
LSTLKKDKDGLANNYDHFSFDSRVKNQIVPNSAKTINAIDQHSKDENTKYETYRKEVSDHLPIVIEIDI